MSWVEGVRESLLGVSWGDHLRYSHGDHEEENIHPQLGQPLCAAS